MSALSISNSTIVSAGQMSPFVISNAGSNCGSSILIHSTLYITNKPSQFSLMPLVSLMSSPPVKTSQPLPHVDGADLVQQTNTIHGSGLFLEAVHFQLGTGPLFDFGLASSHPTTTNPSTTSLTHSSLSNVTSPTSTNKARLFPQSSQILVSCAVEGSTNHFSGTGTADINTCGSFMSHNSSFERCTTDLAESDQHPIYTLLHRTGTSGLVIPPDVPAESPEIQVTRCTFKTMSGSAPGPAVYTLNSLGKTTIHECSFYLCRGTGSGGAVFLQAKSLTHPISQSWIPEFGIFFLIKEPITHFSTNMEILRFFPLEKNQQVSTICYT